MRNLIILMISCGILVRGLCRPRDLEENGNSEVAEAEYESNGGSPEDDSAVSENEASKTNENVEVSDTDAEEDGSHSEDERANEELTGLSANDYESTGSHNKFPDFKSNEKFEQQDDKPQPAMDTGDDNEDKPHDSSKSGEVDRDTVAQSKYSRVARREFNRDLKESELKMNRRNLESRNAPNAEGRFLFNSIQNVAEKVDKNGYNSEAADSLEQPRNNKHYRNTMQAENKDAVSDKHRKLRRFHLKRGRRNTNEGEKDSINSIIPNAPIGVEDVENMNPQDEEAAIKRHVKKLSSEELQELISSLSEDKRKLLKKIMASESEEKDIDKREITMKAESLQDNSNIECGPTDLSKLQEGSTDKTAEYSPSTSLPSSIKIPESTDSSTTSVEIVKETSTPKSTKDAVLQVNELKDDIAGASLSADSSINNSQASNLATSNTKTENKREACLEDNSNSDAETNENDIGSNDSWDSDIHDAFSSQDEGLSQVEDYPLHEDNNNVSKREVSEKPSDYSDLIRSLEDSFPKSDSYDEPHQYCGYAPLIRVKRKNTHPVSHFVKRRQAGVLPEAKVAYFPFRAGNDDEDDEGNEFDDEGFYDRNSNLARNFDDADIAKQSSQVRKLSESQNDNLSEVSENENIESDTSLGSDTDDVLSGIEGVDDNSMFSNSARNKRAPENNHMHYGYFRMPPSAEKESKNCRSMRSVPFIEDERKAITQNYISAQNIPIESDAFGALQKNYDPSVGRHKRVRHVKHSKDLTDSSGT